MDKESIFKMANDAADAFLRAVREAEERFKDDWIPTAQELPAKSGRYLVTIKSKSKRRTEMRNFDMESGTWESATYLPENIIAWQERPLPYNPQS